MKVKLIAIAALGKNRQIGLKNKLPWNLPEEYQHFKNTIKDRHVLIGRKNFELHNGQIQGAKPIVLTRNTTYQCGNVPVFSDLKSVIQHAESRGIDALFVMGGAEIYKLTLPYLSEFIWTEVDYDGPADSYFPEFQHLPWTKIAEETHPGWTLKHLIKDPQKL